MKIKQAVPQKNTAVVQNHNLAKRKKNLESQEWKQRPNDEKQNQWIVCYLENVKQL